MNGNIRFPLGSASIPPMKIVFKGIRLIDEIRSIEIRNPATQLTLHALGEELVINEGLDTEQANGDEEDNLILIDYNEIG
jgi:hypothetical protein